MENCKKHDDQMTEWIMTEWIMCLKTAKEVWDAAFLQKDTYEVTLDPGIILELAKEIYHERMGRRYSVLHRESGPGYDLPTWIAPFEAPRSPFIDPIGEDSDKPRKKEK